MMLRIIFCQQPYKRTAVMTKTGTVVKSPFCIKPYIHKSNLPSTPSAGQVQMCGLFREW